MSVLLEREISNLKSMVSSLGAHVEQNVESACRSGVGTLTDEELEVVARAREQYEALSTVPCTRCGYCMPCPEGVDIPRNIQLYSDALTFSGNQRVLNRNIYRGLPPEARATACVACCECEEKCPQAIPISEWMSRIAEHFNQ